MLFPRQSSWVTFENVRKLLATLNRLSVLIVQWIIFHLKCRNLTLQKCAVFSASTIQVFFASEGVQLSKTWARESPKRHRRYNIATNSAFHTTRPLGSDHSWIRSKRQDFWARYQTFSPKNPDHPYDNSSMPFFLSINHFLDHPKLSEYSHTRVIPYFVFLWIIRFRLRWRERN